MLLLHGASSQIDSTDHMHIDEELERDFAQHGKKSKRGTRVVGIGVFTSAKTDDWEPFFPTTWRCSQLLPHRREKLFIIPSITIKRILLWF